jgi:multicomponent Na+:H+ antiporter subunit D
MDHHIPVLLIITPLLAAPLCVIVRQKFAVQFIVVAISWITFGLAIALQAKVLSSGTIEYQLGGWAAPWGIEYRIDTLSAFVLTFVSAIGAVVAAFAPRSVSDEIPEDRQYLFYTQYLLCLAGLLGIAATGDLFNLFVFLEISSLSSYALISLGRSRRALMAALHYLFMGTIGATFILIGIGLMYMMTGTLNMADMAERLRMDVAVNGTVVRVNETRTVLVAFAFLSVGISLKMALFPLHEWLPNAYTFAPSTVTAFLAATATKVSVYILIRFVYTVYGAGFAFRSLPFDSGLMVLALMGIVVASSIAIFQPNIKRMLAYSSVAQIGYIVLGISFASSNGLTAGIVHLFNHALIKGGLFLAMGCFMLRLGSVELDDLRGVGRRMPFTMFAWSLGGLGLIGVPLTAGFISKWYLMSAALEQGAWPIGLLILMSSLLAVIYVGRVIEVAYFHDPLERHSTVKEAPLSLLVPTYTLIGASLVFGLWTTFSADVARRAAEELLR